MVNTIRKIRFEGVTFNVDTILTVNGAVAVLNGDVLTWQI